MNRIKKGLFWGVLFFTLATLAFATSKKELFEKGVTLLQQDKYQQAVDTFTALIKMDPLNPDAYKNRGVAYMKLNRYDQAISDFEHTRILVPDLKGLYSNLGVAWYYKGDYSKAIKNYNKEIALRPDYYHAYFNRAICWAELKEYENSLHDIDKALEIFPRFYLGLCLKGDLLVKIHKPARAVAAYEKAVQIQPDQVYAREQLDRLKPLPAPVPVKAEKAPLDLPSPSAARWSLQFSACKVRKNAVREMKKLKRKGVDARILEIKSASGVTWYLVRSGAYARRKEAEQAEKKLKSDQGIDTIVRPFGRF